MNRESLFARLAQPHRSKLTSAVGRETRLVGLEPLEDRKMLTTVPTTWVNDNWINLDNPGGPVSLGDEVQALISDGTTIIREYGQTAFGVVEGYTAPGGATIADAISKTNEGGTVQLLNGTFRESDIVINKAITLRGATGGYSSTIVPETVSSKANAQNFAANTHSGIIIYSPNVTIEHININGNGNNSLAGTLNYHHGITTLFDYQNGGNYASIRNGGLAPSNMGDPNASTNIKISNVNVTNTWWHGITLSGVSGTNIRNNRISDVTVSNVGQAGSRDVYRIGILLQNHHDGEVVRSSVSNTGVGIATQTFGPNSWGSSDQARNRTGVRLTTVTDAETRAYSIINFDGTFDLGFILDPNAIFRGFNANKAIYTSTSNNAVGLYINNSDAVVIGYESTNAKVGAKVENTTVQDLRLPVFAGSTITGPGLAVAGSVGILADNQGDPTHAAAFGIAGSTRIAGFETGLKIQQSTVIPGSPSITQVDRAILTGNAVAVHVGNNSIFQGNTNTGGALQTSGTGRIEPGFPDSFFMVENLLEPDNWAGPFSDIANTGNVALSSGGTYSALISGMTGTGTLFNFNQNVTFTEGEIPNAPVDGKTDQPNGTTFPAGQVSQTGGAFVVSGAVNGPLNLAYNTLNHPDPEVEDLFVLEPVDISGFSHLDFLVKLGAGNQAKAFLFGLVDIEGRIGFFTFPTEGLNSSTYTTMSLNLAAPGIPVSLGEGGNVDLSRVVGYAFLGDNGLINGATNVPLELSIDAVNTRTVLNSQLNVTGTVNLNGATLALPLKEGFVPTVSQQFTIINNDGAEAVSGTFAGISNNAEVNLGDHRWRITYNGGTGNDVVATYLGPATSNPATVVGRHIFYNQSKFDGGSAAINPTNDAAAIATDKTAYIPGSGTAVFNNITSYNRGINGIMVDIQNLPGTVTASDFIFKAGNNNTPSAWVQSPVPEALSVVPGGGVGGSDRVIITFPTGTVANRWLEVQVKANANTGLAAPDVHFWGNKVGDTGVGTPAGTFTTSTADASQVFGNLGSNRPITNVYDFNRDGNANTGDASTVFGNQGSIVRLNVGAGGPFAPEAAPAVAGGADTSAVASALAAASKSASAAALPGWIGSRLANVDLNTGSIAKVFTNLAEANTPGTRALLLAANEVTNALDLDDSLLESLIAGLG